jgi:large subunit ribosomal protein L1
MRPTFNYAPARFLSVSAPYAKSHAVKSKLRAEKKAASLRKMQSRKGSGPEKKKKKPRTTFIQYDQKDLMQFSLCDAMRFVPLSHIDKIWLLMSFQIY